MKKAEVWHSVSLKSPLWSCIRAEGEPVAIRLEKLGLTAL